MKNIGLVNGRQTAKLQSTSVMPRGNNPEQLAMRGFSAPALHNKVAIRKDLSRDS